MTWNFVEQNTFSPVFPSQKLYFYQDLSIELKLQCFWKTPKLARSALSTSRPFLRRRYLFSFFAKKKCSKTKLHELYIDGKKKCQGFARHGSRNGRKSHILYTSDFNLLFFGKINPPTRLAISLHTAVKNDVRCAEKAAIVVF